MEYKMNEYQTFIATSRYSKWLPEESRRETWTETVDRYITAMKKQVGDKLPDVLFGELREAILTHKVMPSMRGLMTAGPALDRDPMAIFNCSYVAVDNIRAFDEALYVLMLGTGLGFSVERQYINKLPEIPEELYPTDTLITVTDSKLGWAKAYKELLSLLYAGLIPQWDLSHIRAKGERLKTFGGRASGPEPLRDLFRFTVEVFQLAKGRKLRSIEAHDIMCKIGEIVVVGGVRRSALISLSNLTDERMRNAKSGQWWEANPQRALSNNSVAYTEKPDIGIFMKEWHSLYDSKSGERGIFNRAAAERLVPDRRKELNYKDYGTNPCSEIILRSAGVCNLTTCVIRKGDSKSSIKEKIRLATILGTIQATFTSFRYVRPIWRHNAREEALLGVSLTGIMDNTFLSEPSEELAEYLQGLEIYSEEVNREYADVLTINHSMATTCIKPEGTTSQLTDSASGLHARHSLYYIRTVRADNKDPLAIFMRDKGFPVEVDVMKPDSGLVFSFPIKSPEGSVTRNDRSAIEQLEMWKFYQLNYCSHKPSVTITVREEEWMDVGAWCYSNFDILSGVSFLPHSDHSYQQAPYQEISEEDYKELLAEMPVNTDWKGLEAYEEEDNTTGTQTLACTGGVCEVVDLE